MKVVPFDYGSDAAPQGEKAEGIYAELRDAVQRLRAADEEVTRAEEALRRARHGSAELRERVIPQIMDRAGLERCEYKDIEVEIESKVHVSLPSHDKDPDRRLAALKWFMDNGHGRLVRNEFSVQLPAGDTEQADFLRDVLNGAELDFDQKATIHSSTLLAWTKEQLRDGGAVPSELLGLHEQRLAKIKVK